MGRGLRLYLDKAHSLLGGQGQPFIQDGGGSGVSPAGTGPCRPGPQGRAEVTQAPGSHLSRLLLRSPSVGPVRSQLLPPLQAPSEGRLPWHLSPCCLLAQSPHPCRPVPTGTEGQSLSSSQPKELQPLLPPAFPQFPTCRSMAALLPTPAASPSRAPHFLRTHGGGAVRDTGGSWEQQREDAGIESKRSGLASRLSPCGRMPSSVSGAVLERASCGHCENDSG